jgi:hypothetical protein
MNRNAPEFTAAKSTNAGFVHGYVAIATYWLSPRILAACSSRMTGARAKQEVSVTRQPIQPHYDHSLHAIERTTPPSTRSPAPVVAEAWSEQT